MFQYCRRFYAPSSRPPWRRTWCLVLSGFVAFFFFVYVMAMLGRGTSAYDADGNIMGGNGADAVQSHM